MPGRKLTIKQEKFCQAYIETGNASEAYRRAYSAKKMKPETVNNKAYGLLKKGEIRARLDELQSKHAKRHEITVEKITQMLLEDHAMARELEQMSSAVSAAMHLAKIHGHVTDKSQVQGNLTVNVHKMGKPRADG
jgi:phage terminase small subunit